METKAEERFIYDGFLISVLLKGAISLVEVVSGIAALFIPPLFIVGVAGWLIGFIPFGHVQALLLTEVAAYTGGAVTFVALYLFSRGIIKVFLIWALLRNQLWAYPSSLIVLAAFVAYQCYQIATTHSIIVIGITLFDLVVMYFIYREWQVVKRQTKEPTA